MLMILQKSFVLKKHFVLLLMFKAVVLINISVENVIYLFFSVL